VPGGGSTFRLSVPVWAGSTAGKSRPGEMAFSGAFVSLRSPQLSAYVASELRGLGVEVSQGPWSAESPAALLVTDDVEERLPELAAFVGVSPSRRAVLIGAVEGHASEQVSVVGERPTPGKLRSALVAAVNGPGVQQEELAS